jgi:hypothetical protein
LKRKRTSDEQKIEQNSHYAEMETSKPPDDASAAFHRQAYQSIEVMDYIRKIHKGGGAGGQAKTEKVHTEQSET